jgi:hypothetical protein
MTKVVRESCLDAYRSEALLLTYLSKHLNKIVVGYTKLEVKPARQSNGHHRSTPKRSLRPTVQIIDPNRDPMKVEPEDSVNEAMGPLESVQNLFPIGNQGKEYWGC